MMAQLCFDNVREWNERLLEQQLELDMLCHAANDPE